MKDLTRKQQKVLGLIQAAWRRQGRSPTYQDLARSLGVTVRAAFQHVQALERKGYVRRSRRHRGMELAAEVRPEVGIPVVGRVAAGRPVLAVENIDEYIRPPGFDGEEDIFSLRIQGDSMTGRGIHDGDFAIVRLSPEIRDGEVGVFILGDEATVKTARFRRDRSLELHPENPAYPVIRARDIPDEIRLAGKVVGVFRRV